MPVRSINLLFIIYITLHYLHLHYLHLQLDVFHILRSGSLVLCFVCLIKTTSVEDGNLSKVVVVWHSGNNVALDQQIFCTSGLVSTWMDDHR